ncbi:MAG: hypothetical protein COB09_11215 [Thalassobium sp.]|nr:MAG: hypothetical protein COB09_11215 [Thalassobium sp.]
MDIVQRLELAAEAGEVLDVIYHGGSQPGATRKLTPIRVNGHKFHAKCMETGKFKFYMIEKLEIIGEPLPLPDDWTPDHVIQYEKEKYRNQKPQRDPAEFAETTMTAMADAGWVVMHNLAAVEVDGTEYLSGMFFLHSKFKSGKPKKTPTLSFSIQPYETELGEFPDESTTTVQPKARPYGVYGKCKGKAFSSLNSAADYFNEQAALLAMKYLES